jgi:beta-glucanase (GH16 family)
LGGVKVATPGTAYSQDYHVYAVDWQSDHVDWYLDGVKYYTVNKGDGDWQTGNQGATPSSDGWPFNIPHYLIFNMAMGGQWPGAPDPSITQGDLLIDYVRVYQRQ